MPSANGTNTANGKHPLALPAATRLRRMLNKEEIIVAPGVYDGFSARIAHEVGFDCIYMVNHASQTYLLCQLTFTDGSWHLCIEAWTA